MNYQEMWILFKKYIRTKSAHGKLGLLAEMEKLEIDQINSSGKEEENK